MSKSLRRLICVMAAALATMPSLLSAQAAKPLPRIAYVWLFGIGPSAPFADAFTGRMAELGWVDGKTITISYHDAQGDPAKLDAILRNLVDLKIDILVVPACGSMPGGLVAMRSSRGSLKAGPGPAATSPASPRHCMT